MGVVGTVLARVVGLFIGSSAPQFELAVAGVIAWDAQRIKELYLSSDPGTMLTKTAAIGALALYLDFINLLVKLLQVTGQRRQ